MIIICHDKEIIIYENIVEISIRDLTIYDFKCFGIIAQTVNNQEKVLGTYETEKRAKKVLYEIGKCYLNTEQYKCFSSMTDYIPEEKVKLLNDLAENAFRYVMPKE